MTPKKQVSPAIRILRGERDASARATHLEAATRKFLVTTNERKQMSTKTNFKRIALVAIAALGMGVLSSVPSQALVVGDITVTSTAGTATKVKSDSTTAATLTVSYTSTAADTVTISFASLSKPTDATVTPVIDIFGNSLGETAAISAAAGVDTSSSTGATAVQVYNYAVGSSWNSTRNDTATITSAANAFNSAVFKLSMDTVTGTRVAGTYTYTAIVTAYSTGMSPQVVTTKTAVVTFTIAALTAESTTPSAATSSALISAAGGVSVDEAVSAVATASTTPAALIEVKLRNASGSSGTVAGKESVTVTTTAGTVGVTGGTFGRSVVLAYSSTGVAAGDSLTVYVRPDGTAATATINISTPSVTFAPKTVVFYATAPSTLVASALNTTPGIGTTGAAISVVAKDSNGNPWAGTLYTYSDTVGTISDSGTSCSYVAANSRHECSVTGAAAGTAKITVRNHAASAIVATTVSSNAVSLTTSASSPATVKLTFDKATYAPGEKATLLVSVLDSTGKSVSANTFANLFATGGISLTTAAGNGSDTVTAVSIQTVSLASAALSTTLTDPVKAYTIYMPSAGGAFTASATGGATLPLAGQVKVSATATVTDSGAAALAAVNALATTVASLKTLITTLTNLVLKIQKKVKA
jgi:trimeric autotransporter adhesin